MEPPKEYVTNRSVIQGTGTSSNRCQSQGLLGRLAFQTTAQGHGQRARHPPAAEERQPPAAVVHGRRCRAEDGLAAHYFAKRKLTENGLVCFRTLCHQECLLLAKRRCLKLSRNRGKVYLGFTLDKGSNENISGTVGGSSVGGVCGFFFHLHPVLSIALLEPF